MKEAVRGLVVSGMRLPTHKNRRATEERMELGMTSHRVIIGFTTCQRLKGTEMPQTGCAKGMNQKCAFKCLGRFA